MKPGSQLIVRNLDKWKLVDPDYLCLLTVIEVFLSENEIQQDPREGDPLTKYVRAIIKLFNLELIPKWNALVQELGLADKPYWVVEVPENK